MTIQQECKKYQLATFSKQLIIGSVYNHTDHWQQRKNEAEATYRTEEDEKQQTAATKY